MKLPIVFLLIAGAAMAQTPATSATPVVAPAANGQSQSALLTQEERALVQSLLSRRDTLQQEREKLQQESRAVAMAQQLLDSDDAALMQKICEAKGGESCKPSLGDKPESWSVLILKAKPKEEAKK